MREEFEVWAVNNGYSMNKITADCYTNMFTQIAWDAYQASRQALVVELPPIQAPTNDSDFSEGCHTGRLTYQDAVIDVLQEIGIKCK